MGPEEYYHIERIILTNIREYRITSLHWAWDNLSSGSIKRETIIELIPYLSLSKLLSDLEVEERYEDCKVVFDIMNLYKENEKYGEYKQLF